MKSNLNISVLVSARDEYIQQLKCILIPLIYQGFNSIYEDAVKITNGKKVIYKFQELLKEIPNWNQTILHEESKRIKKKCTYIMDIVTAIFVTNVKILASVRLKGSKDDIRVKIPTSDIFIHGIYIESAQQIFYDPFLFYHKKNEFIQKNKQIVRDIISISIDETIRRMLPFDDILQKYLADALNNNAEINSSEDGSDLEEDLSDSDEESINNDDLPSDESGSESEYDEEENKIKSFNIGKNETNYTGEQIIPPTEQFFEQQRVDVPVTTFTEQQFQPPVQQNVQQFQPSVQPPLQQFQPPVQQNVTRNQDDGYHSDESDSSGKNEQRNEKYSFFD